MAQILDIHTIQKLLLLKHSERFFVTSDTHFYHEKILKRVPNRNAYKNNGFYKINTGHVKANGLVMKLKGITILFSHYPVFVLPRWETEATKILREIFIKFSCDINIHGHTHDVILKDSRLINVSLDVTDYKPVLLKNLLNRHANKSELF